MDRRTYESLHVPIVERRLERLLCSAGSQADRLFDAMRYATLGGGKRFRPLLVIASHIACGGEPPQNETAAVIDAGCAVELVHCFSLIHDDLPALDDDELRRGKPACHIAFGEGIAVLAGDALFALSQKALAEMNAGFEIKTECFRTLSKAVQEMVEGQTLDIEMGKESVDPLQLETIHVKKTGALMGASCRFGALLAGCDQQTADAHESIGRKIGVLFQIWDDVLDASAMEPNLVRVIGMDAARAYAEAKSAELMKELDAAGGGFWALRLMAESAVRRPV